MILDVDCLAANEIPKSLVDRCFGAHVPEKNRPIPPPTVEQVGISGMPFDAEHAVSMGAHVARFQGLRVSLVQMPQQHIPILLGNHVPLPVVADFAGLERRLILNGLRITCFENSSC